MQKNKELLSEVVIIRPILIILLVFYHSFAIYCGGWDSIEGFPTMKAYWWLGKISYSFMLEMFVFISGYLLGYQVRTKGEERISSTYIFWGKFKRLIIPSIFFSFAYVLLFRNITSRPLLVSLYEILDGAGHMWFLPMLYWCFCSTWVINKLKIKQKYCFITLLILSILPQIPLPLNIGKTLYYLLFFYTGYYVKRENISMKNLCRPNATIIIVSFFVVLFFSLTIIQEKASVIINPDSGLFFKIIKVCILNISKIIYSSIGILMTLSFAGLICSKCDHMPYYLQAYGDLCMGVYLFQQFILIGLYYYSSLPFFVGPYWLPWIGFFIALMGSSLLSYYLRKTKFGRILI